MTNSSDLPTSVADHEAKSRGVRATCAVITVSDTRTTGNDESGDTIERLLVEAGHDVAARQIVPDDVARIGGQVDALKAQAISVILLTGGTGVSPRDKTLDAVLPRLTAELPGFGETFRRLSYDEIGPPAMLSRATAGITRGSPTVLFALPGSRHAVELAVSKLIVPMLPHLLKQVGLDQA